MTTNKGTALTPRMQAAVERRKANSDPLHTALQDMAKSSADRQGVLHRYLNAHGWRAFGSDVDELMKIDPATAALAAAQQAIRERDAKIAALETVAEDAKGLLKNALEREEGLRKLLSEAADRFEAVQADVEIGIGGDAAFLGRSAARCRRLSADNTIGAK